MRQTRLCISLSAIEENYRRIRRFCAGDAKFMAVIKADAYGHGMTQVARRLEDAGAEMFGVAILEEALALRDAGIKRPVLVMGGIVSGGADEAVNADISTAVYDTGALDALERAARAQGKPARAHLKIDTGMARIGVRGEKALGAFLEHWKRCPNVEMEGAYTHFAIADADPKFTRRQDEAFRYALKRVRAAGFSPIVHEAATSGASFAAYRHDMIRVGIGLYGYLMPQLGLQMAQRITTKPVRIETIQPGDTVSYGRTFAAARETRIMTLPIGYGDGYPRLLGNRADLLVRGKRAPIVGRVCMDMLMADVTDIPGVCMDDEVVLLGRQEGECITADELAKFAETIPYEIILGFSPRGARTWEDS